MACRESGGDELAVDVAVARGRSLDPLAALRLEEQRTLPRELRPDVLLGGHVVVGPVVDFLQLSVHSGPGQMRADLEGHLDEQLHRRPRTLSEERRLAGYAAALQPRLVELHLSDICVKRRGR